MCRALIVALQATDFPHGSAASNCCARSAWPSRDIAWKAQERLCRRYRRLARAGKLPTLITAAIARELAGFVWAIAKQVQLTHA